MKSDSKNGIIAAISTAQKIVAAHQERARNIRPHCGQAKALVEMECWQSRVGTK